MKSASDAHNVLPTMRFPLQNRFMHPFWVHLPVQFSDDIGSEQTQIRCNEPEVDESYRIELRGDVFRFDEIEELFSKYLDESARLLWLLVVELVHGEHAQSCLLRIDGWKSVCREAVADNHPRPSFFLRAALTLATQSLVSRWHSDWEGGFEEALSDLRLALGEEATIRTCFFCKWSDYEPSTSTGHLRCFRAVKTEYEAIAISEDSWTRKYKKENLYGDLVWVDELNVCSDFQRRPLGFGYRG